MDFPTLNWLAILAAVVVNMVLGFLWYSPVLFGSYWQKLMGFKDADMKGGSSMTWLVMVVGEVITAVVIAVFVKWLGTTSLMDALWLGLMFGALHLFPTLTNAYFGGMGKKDKVMAAWVDAGYVVVAYVLVTMILVWMK